MYMYTLIRSNAWWWAYIHIHSIYLREWVGGDSDQITTNAPLHMMGSMLSCLITNDDEIARLPKLIIPKTFTFIGTIWKNLGFSDMSCIYISKFLEPWHIQRIFWFPGRWHQILGDSTNPAKVKIIMALMFKLYHLLRERYKIRFHILFLTFVSHLYNANVFKKLSHTWQVCPLLLLR